MVREAGTGWGLSLPNVERHPVSGPPTFTEGDRISFSGRALVAIGLVPDSRRLQAAPQEQMPSWSSGWRYYREQVEGSLRAFLAPGHQCFRRRTGTGLNFVLRRRLAHAHQETEQQISPQQGEIASC
jgi:hypothetical protein